MAIWNKPNDITLQLASQLQFQQGYVFDTHRKCIKGVDLASNWEIKATPLYCTSQLSFIWEKYVALKMVWQTECMGFG